MNKNKKNKSSKKNNFSSKLFRTIIILLLIIGASFLLDKIGLELSSFLDSTIFFDIFYILTLLGEWYVFIWMVIVIGLIMFINKKPGVTFALTLVVTAIINTIAKFLINRQRPFEALNVTSVIPTSLSSFPSGHAMMMFCMIPIISKSFPKTKIFVWGIAILVSLSRIYLGVHYVSDVVAGAIFGYLTGYAVLKISEKYSWRY